eukprot:m.55672 g.55672  ORF g.55672 m.55672 type:complete len:149 (-) comp11505_c0_seq2:572-1018(-)
MTGDYIFGRFTPSGMPQTPTSTPTKEEPGEANTTEPLTKKYTELLEFKATPEQHVVAMEQVVQTVKKKHQLTGSESEKKHQRELVAQELHLLQLMGTGALNSFGRSDLVDRLLAWFRRVMDKLRSSLASVFDALESICTWLKSVFRSA